MNVDARLLLALALILLLNPRSPANAQQVQPLSVVLDGTPLPDKGILWVDGNVYLPLARMAEACGLPVKVESDGTVEVGTRRFLAATVRVEDRVYVARADVKRALDATVYVDTANGRVVVLTPRGQKQATKRGGSEVAAPPRPVVTQRPGAQPTPRTVYTNQGPQPHGGHAPTSAPPPTGGPSRDGIAPGPPPPGGGPPQNGIPSQPAPQAGNQPPYGDPSKGGSNPFPPAGGGTSEPVAGKGAGSPGGPGGPPPGPGAPGASAPAGSVQVTNIELDRSPAHNNFLRVRGRVRNASGAPLRNLTVTFSLWREGSPETTDPATGDRVCQGGSYSDYPSTVGTLAPGEWRDIEIVTSVARPQKLDFGARLVELDDRGAFDSFAVRRLRYGFKASATP